MSIAGENPYTLIQDNDEFLILLKTQEQRATFVQILQQFAWDEAREVKEIMKACLPGLRLPPQWGNMPISQVLDTYMLQFDPDSRQQFKKAAEKQDIYAEFCRHIQCSPPQWYTSGGRQQMPYPHQQKTVRFAQQDR